MHRRRGCFTDLEDLLDLIIALFVVWFLISGWSGQGCSTQQ